MILFDLNQQHQTDLLHVVTATDAILLRQEAVYLMHNPQIGSLSCALYCLAADAAIRGLVISAPFTALDDRQWLELVLNAEHSL